MALIANREARHYTTSILVPGPKDAHGNARVGQRRMVLKPGVNDVDDDLWIKCKANPRVMQRVREGTLEILEEPEKGDKPQASTPADRMAVGLGELNVRDAKRLIKETIDVPLLEAWADVDDRKGVLEAIDIQLGKVTKNTNDEDVVARRGARRRAAADTEGAG